MEEHVQYDEVEVSQPTLPKHALISGVITGGISVFISLFTYFMSVGKFVEGWADFVTMFTVLGLVIYFGIQYRKVIGGYISFKDAFLHGLIIFTVAGLMDRSFQYVMYNFVNPDLVQMKIDQSIEGIVQMGEILNFSEDTMDAQIETIEKELKNAYNLGKMFWGYLLSVLIYAGISLVTALIVRKREPEDDF